MGDKAMVINKIYVEFVDGVPFCVPVEATFISEGIYQILPNKEFDYEDDSVLFEFGQQDVVRVKVGQFVDGKQALRAYELVESGDQRNLQKRLLSYILMKEIAPFDLLDNVDKNEIRALESKINGADFMYPSIKEWLALHKKEIWSLVNSEQV
jgi:hypothetical protein